MIATTAAFLPEHRAGYTTRCVSQRQGTKTPFHQKSVQRKSNVFFFLHVLFKEDAPDPPDTPFILVYHPCISVIIHLSQYSRIDARPLTALQNGAFSVYEPILFG